MNGQIIRIISNLYTVKCGELIYGCKARGKFRNMKISPVVGDNVLIDVNDNVIVDILPRKNELTRPVVANVDVVLIVTSVKNPNLDLNLLDKLISVVTYNDIEPVICFTKLDLLNEDEINYVMNLKNYYEMIGIKVVFNSETVEIKKLLKNKLVVLAGQTGAGKSSLINSLNSELNLKTDEISLALGRGKHTTRHVELFEIGEGLLADTPGFSCVSLAEMSKEQIRDSFVEFSNYQCKYRDCMHDKEIGCAVKEALDNKKILQSRYENYMQFLRSEKR